MRPWHHRPLVGFDVESTGVNPLEDRIVTAAVLRVGPQRWKYREDNAIRWMAPTRFGWVVDPGVEIPEGAAKVHGITTERARQVGRPAARVVLEVATVLAEHIVEGTPIIAMNAPYDLTMLDRELRRHGHRTLAELAGLEPVVVDPLVLDRQVDRYRRGKRNLTALSEHYGVTLDGAHEAAADALAAVKVAYEIAERHPAIGNASLADLHTAQVVWAAEQADGLRQYLVRQGRDASAVHGHWPLIPRQEVAS
ncbi:exonuclease domain-containing protein [Kitasatospora cathayae]|uniref:Exonuclease domain-containing protein n=1 Tax=Kitasatospora cathayae TaxID=3004092 RepID=A0ABY7QA07_9ACTN|nr:exonuclease domain-containing protein [Kitasatospora sp. HUAS 3-15]WBP89483.1 exonuclease domain-containing protein [Kitasatospora sp. HUAS 3-15]